MSAVRLYRRRFDGWAKIGFTRDIYKPQPLRPLEGIRADILALERGTEGLLVEIMG